MAIDIDWVRENPEEAAKQINMLSEQRDDYRTAEEYQIALRQKVQAEKEAIENHAERFKGAVIKASMNGFGQDDVHHDDSWIDELDHALMLVQHFDAKRRQAEGGA